MIAAALNDTTEDAACLEAALQTLEEPSSDPTIASALDDPEEEAACLEALEGVEPAFDPVEAALDDPEEEEACVAALEAAEQEQLPLEFEVIPHVDRRVRKLNFHDPIDPTWWRSSS